MSLKRKTDVELKRAVRPFERADARVAVRDAVLAVGGAVVSLGVGVALALAGVWPLALMVGALGGLFLMKVFIVQHDCGHGSFFASAVANRWVGRVCSILTLTPYKAWAMEHALHHANFGNLDKPQVGEIALMTVAQYRQAGWGQRVYYRVYRHPLFLLVAAPLLLFVVRYRWTSLHYRAAWVSALATDAVLVAMYGALFYALGAAFWVVVWAWYVGGFFALAMFYVQHAFEGVKFERATGWSHAGASAQNCSYLLVPRWLAFFSGNIQYHHWHHFSSKIPSYNLPAVQAALGGLLPATQVRMRDVPRAFSLGLWDEDAGRMVSFAALK